MEKEILRTLAYANIFNFPLKKEEIWRWLILEERRVKIEDKSNFIDSLKFLLDSRQIQEDQNYYYLSNKQKNIALRKKRERWSADKIIIAKKTIKIFRFIPWIKLIGITGSLAMNNADKNADIDLFFIVAQRRLWLTRGLVVLILRLKGIYRQPQKIKDMVCPNMFVSDKSMEISLHNLFTAHEICQMVPILDKDDTYSKFLGANSWITNYLPNAVKEREARLDSARLAAKRVEPRRSERAGEQEGEEKIFSVDPRLDKLLSAIDYLAMKTQLFYMRKHRTTEIVSRDLIKFHPHDISLKILNLVRLF